MHIGHIRWAINEDAESELRFWVNELLVSLGLGVVFGFATGITIALLPDGEEGSASAFIHEFWPYLVECAFWLGLFLGLLWGAGKRLGSALAGTLPWQELQEERIATGRLFGQWAAFAALAGFFLWLIGEVALAAGMQDMALLAAGFTPLTTTCWMAAGLFALVGVASRRRPAKGRAMSPERR
jgi:hypothetical protein